MTPAARRALRRLRDLAGVRLAVRRCRGTWYVVDRVEGGPVVARGRTQREALTDARHRIGGRRA